MARRRRAAVAAALMALAAMAGALEVPYLAGRVNDLAGLLSADAAGRIEERLARLEEETGAQAVVLTVPTLEGESLEEFSLRVAETWKLGREGIDDGVLLLVARDDRKMRLEVGYGLEGRIPDAAAGRILDRVLRPRFREGDFDGGLEAAAESIERLVRGEVEALPTAQPVTSSPSSPPGGLPALLFFGLFLLVIGPMSLAALTAKGAHGWFLYLFLIPFWISFPLALFGTLWGFVAGGLWIGGGALLRLLFRHTEGGRRLVESTSFGRHLSSSRSWSSSRGWSSGGGGRGFSGGGGGFGGGGASSSW